MGYYDMETGAWVAEPGDQGYQDTSVASTDSGVQTGWSDSISAPASSQDALSGRGGGYGTSYGSTDNGGWNTGQDQQGGRGSGYGTDYSPTPGGGSDYAKYTDSNSGGDAGYLGQTGANDWSAGASDPWGYSEDRGHAAQTGQTAQDQAGAGGASAPWDLGHTPTHNNNNNNNNNTNPYNYVNGGGGGSGGRGGPDYAKELAEKQREYDLSRQDNLAKEGDLRSRYDDTTISNWDKEMMSYRNDPFAYEFAKFGETPSYGAMSPGTMTIPGAVRNQLDAQYGAGKWEGTNFDPTFNNYDANRIGNMTLRSAPPSLQQGGNNPPPGLVSGNQGVQPGNPSWANGTDPTFPTPPPGLGGGNQAVQPGNPSWAGGNEQGNSLGGYTGPERRVSSMGAFGGGESTGPGAINPVAPGNPSWASGFGANDNNTPAPLGGGGATDGGAYGAGALGMSTPGSLGGYDLGGQHPPGMPIPGHLGGGSNPLKGMGGSAPIGAQSSGGVAGSSQLPSWMSNFATANGQAPITPSAQQWNQMGKTDQNFLMSYDKNVKGVDPGDVQKQMQDEAPKAGAQIPTVFK